MFIQNQISDQELHAAVVSQRDFAAAFFNDLAAKSTDPNGGITRDTYGKGENHGHAVMAAATRASGFELNVDAAGNTYARWPGARPNLTVLMGSHLDSVPCGGNFDGAAGALAGLVCMRALQSLGVEPTVSLSAMGIRAEESVWFQTSYIGSRAALGTLPIETYDNAKRIDTGRSLADHMADCGCDLPALRAGHRSIDPASIEAFIELHIEQAPSLVEMGKPLASCTAIPGNFRYPDVAISGVHGHVGTPRRFRTDAAMAGAELATEMDKIWAEKDAKGVPLAMTFGRFHTDDSFHGLTTVPGLFHFSIDVRAYDAQTLEQLEQSFLALVDRISAKRGVQIVLGERKSAPVGTADAQIREKLRAIASRMKIDMADLGSPASHDAAAFAAEGVPMAMIFVRNENGSHNPDEAMDIDDFLAGCAVMTSYLYETYCV